MYLMNQNKHYDSVPKITEDDWRAEHHFRKVEHIRANAARIAGESDDAYTHRLHDEHTKAVDINQMAGEAAGAFEARVTCTIEGLERRAAWVRDSVEGGIAKAGHFMHDQAQHMGEMAGDAKHRIGDLAGRAKHSAVDVYDQNPLAASALGVALGALLGSLAPLSSLARDKLQGVGGEAMKAGANLAERGAAKVEKAAASIDH